MLASPPRFSRIPLSQPRRKIWRVTKGGWVFDPEELQRRLASNGR